MASQRKVRGQKFPQDVFDIDLTEALQSLLRPQDFSSVAASDRWTFHVSDLKLVITRTKAAEDN